MWPHCFRAAPNEQELPLLTALKKAGCLCSEPYLEGMSFIVFSIHREVTNAAAALLLTRELSGCGGWGSGANGIKRSLFSGRDQGQYLQAGEVGHEAKKQRSILSMKWLRRCAPYSDVLLTR